VAGSPPRLVVLSEEASRARDVGSDRRDRPNPAVDPTRRCGTCGGRGRQECEVCRGKGRTNRPEATMLPHGEWPQWCPCCRGSGLSICLSCNGDCRERGAFPHMVANNPAAAHPGGK